MHVVLDAIGDQEVCAPVGHGIGGAPDHPRDADRAGQRGLGRHIGPEPRADPVHPGADEQPLDAVAQDAVVERLIGRLVDGHRRDSRDDHAGPCQHDERRTSGRDHDDAGREQRRPHGEGVAVLLPEALVEPPPLQHGLRRQSDLGGKARVLLQEPTKVVLRDVAVEHTGWVGGHIDLVGVVAEQRVDLRLLHEGQEVVLRDHPVARAGRSEPVGAEDVGVVVGGVEAVPQLGLVEQRLCGDLCGREGFRVVDHVAEVGDRHPMIDRPRDRRVEHRERLGETTHAVELVDLESEPCAARCSPTACTTVTRAAGSGR
ncbi:MAG: hypothetical protein R2695_15075 [Acidimicrobiales bacterium]